MKTKKFALILFIYSIILFFCGNSINGESNDTIDPSVDKIIRVEFENEGVTLSGTLWLPEGNGPWPGMIIVHGSGRSTQNHYSGTRNIFLQNNVAVLTYDKRGVENSGGTYEGNNNGSAQNLTLLGRDADKGLDKLKSFEFIDNDKIGIWGNSQAGRISRSCIYYGQKLFVRKQK